MKPGFSSNAWDPSLLDPWNGTFQLKGTVVIPAYGNARRLDAVLAALARQTYPRDLTEVIVVDDGSEPPLAPATPDGMNLRVLFQEDLGYRLAAARNLGAAQADGSFLAYLDSDMLPETGWLAAHAMVHHRQPWAVSIGYRRHVALTEVDPSAVASVVDIPDLFKGMEFTEPSWFRPLLEETDNGRSNAHELWRITHGGNSSMATALYWAAGGNDEDLFTIWGGEDNELGYRMIQQGAMVVPNPKAMAWHLGPSTSGTAEGRRKMEATWMILVSRIPGAGSREDRLIVPKVPELAIEVEVGQTELVEVVRSVRSLIDAADNSIGIHLAIPEDHKSRDLIAKLVGADSRLSTASDRTAGEIWPNARVLLRTPPLSWNAGKVARVLSETSEGASGIVRIRLGDGSHCESSLVRVINQTRHGLIAAEQVFETVGGVWLDWDAIG